MKIISKNFPCLLFALFFYSVSLYGELRLHNVFSDNMVLQRNQPIQVWGWGTPGEAIELTFANQNKVVAANEDGEWLAVFDAMKAGGPYTLVVKEGVADVAIRIENIMLGDVWLCGGQSNMEWQVRRFKWAGDEIEKADFSQIRMMNVRNSMSTMPGDDIQETEWKEATGDNIANFSAVGYLFGKEIYGRENIPIGLISSNWGGTNVETWMSRQSLVEWPHIAETEWYKPEAYKAFDRYLEHMEQVKDSIAAQDPGYVDKWFHVPLQDDLWESHHVVPESFSETFGEDFLGTVWLSRYFDLPTPFRGEDIRFNLDRVAAYARIWINGELVNTVTRPRSRMTFDVDENVLKEEQNQIVIQYGVFQEGQGMHGNAFQYSFHPVHNSRGSMLLSGNWKYKVGLTLEEEIIFPEAPRHRTGLAYDNPSALYNAMIHPLANIALSGVIWYQGESNVGLAYEYRELFPAMIKDWRRLFQQEDLPFLFVQLANYTAVVDTAGDSDWAELREAQAMALSLHNTAMAVTIDIGETWDIHPPNKQDVALRLALAASHLVYGKELVYSGPMYKHHQIKGNEVIVSFDHVGSGLQVKDDPYGYVRGFAIAGEDQRFYFAQARIQGDQIVVSSEHVKKPVAVRYAWANNPLDANLYNKEGLPAVPFRTDDWEGVTYGKKFPGN